MLVDFAALSDQTAEAVQSHQAKKSDLDGARVLVIRGYERLDDVWIFAEQLNEMLKAGSW